MAERTRSATIAARVAALERRVAALAGEREDRAPPTSKSALDLLEALANRSGARFVRRDDRGAIAYAGVAKFNGREYRWAREHGIPELLGAEWASASTILECLGGPVRPATQR